MSGDLCVSQVFDQSFKHRRLDHIERGFVVVQHGHRWLPASRNTLARFFLKSDILTVRSVKERLHFVLLLHCIY